MAQKTLLSDKPEKLIKRYKEILRKNNIHFEEIILFGSFAKGNQKMWSDMDLCVVSKQFGKDLHNEMVFLNYLTNTIDDMIEVHPYHPKDLEDPFDPLASEIRKYGKVVT